MVTEDTSKFVAPPPKASRPFKKADLPDGLNYELLCHTIIPTVVTYYTHQREPWDHPASILCGEIHTITRHTGRVNFEVDSKSTIYKNVCTCSSWHYPYSFVSQVTQWLSDSWWAVIGSVSTVLIMTFIFKNQKSKFPMQANEQLTNWCFLYMTMEGNVTKVSCYFSNILYLTDCIYESNGVASSIMQLSWAPLQLTLRQLKVPNESQISKLMEWNLLSLMLMVLLCCVQLG